MPKLDILRGDKTPLFFDNKKLELEITLKKVMRFYRAVKRDNLSTINQIDYALFILTGEVFGGGYTVKEQLLMEIFEREIKLATDEQEEYDLNGNLVKKEVNEEADTAPVYSLTQDFDYIYSDFLREYRIDLLDNDISWRRFNALLSALTDDSKLMRVIAIRKWKPNKNTSEEEKEQYRELKEYYRIREE